VGRTANTNPEPATRPTVILALAAAIDPVPVARGRDASGSIFRAAAGPP